jgi:hypothetical protein
MKIWTIDIWQESGMGGHYTQFATTKTTQAKAIEAGKKWLREHLNRKLWRTADPEVWKTDYRTYCGPYYISVTSTEID